VCGTLEFSKIAHWNSEKWVWDDAGGSCNVAVPNLPRREVDQTGVYWLALGLSARTSGGRFCWLPRYCPFSSLKACCPTHSLLSVWDSAVGKFWIVTETMMQWCKAQVGTVSSVVTMYVCGSCIRVGRSRHTSRYWARLWLQPHWLSRGARRPGAAPDSLSQPCWVCIPRSLAWFSAWTPSYWCHTAQSRWRIPVFRHCIVKPQQFLQSVCVFRTLAAGTLWNSRAGASMRWLSSMCKRTTSRLLVYQHSFTRVHTSKRSDPHHCALQMCSIARNFAHQTSMYVIWTTALLNLGFSASSAQHLAPSTIAPTKVLKSKRDRKVYCK